MAFWLFMAVMDLLIPATMLFFGRRFQKQSPKEINCLFGYRTERSMKNRDTWDFAHRYAGKVWWVLGWITLALTLPVLVWMFGRDIETVGLAGAITAVVQCVPMVGAIIPVEIALARTFDKNGRRKTAGK